MNCYVCDANFNKVDATVKEVVHHACSLLGPRVLYTYPLVTCPSCGEEADFDNEADSAFEAALRQANQEGIDDTLNDLNRAQIPDMQIDLMLIVGIGTVARWRKGEWGPEVPTLLSLLKGRSGTIQYLMKFRSSEPAYTEEAKTPCRPSCRRLTGRVDVGYCMHCKDGKWEERP